MNTGLNCAVIDQVAQKLGCTIAINEPLAPRTTFRIGGPACRLVAVSTSAQLSGILYAAQKEEIPWFVLGKGSNLLVGDRGFPGLVICLEGDFKRVNLLSDGRTLQAGAAASLATVCAAARGYELTGMEFAWGIPASVGGALYMNAGAYGGEMKDVAVTVSHIDGQGRPGQFSGDDLSFSYRCSRYADSSAVITAGYFRLTPGASEEIAVKMDELMSRRKEKQPYDMPSAGSTFKRPKTGYAAALIDQCGLKGVRVGGAQVSEKHGGFIVNTGGATCKDVLALIEKVQTVVLQKTGIELEPEVRVIGEL